VKQQHARIARELEYLTVVGVHRLADRGDRLLHDADE
jgi:hypothetical protein